MKVLITGITGMVGSHLAEYLNREHPEVEVFGVVRPRSDVRFLADARVALLRGDLTDLGSLIRILATVGPDLVFHLGAQSFVPASFAAPGATMEANVQGTTNLLEACVLFPREQWPKVHICSSSEVYGQVEPDEVPITETQPFRPASPYAVSKAAADLLARQYFLTHGLHTVTTRMFTHTGPRRGRVFAEGAFASQIAAVERGALPNPIRVGNLDSIRTIADVRDAVRAYWLLMEKAPAGSAWNIGGDETMTVGEVLERLKKLARVPIEHEVHPSLLRASDVTRQIPDSRPFRELTGWKPTYTVDQTLSDLLDYYRQNPDR